MWNICIKRTYWQIGRSGTWWLGLENSIFSVKRANQRKGLCWIKLFQWQNKEMWWKSNKMEKLLSHSEQRMKKDHKNGSMQLLQVKFISFLRNQIKLEWFIQEHHFNNDIKKLISGFLFKFYQFCLKSISTNWCDFFILFKLVKMNAKVVFAEVVMEK